MGVLVGCGAFVPCGLGAQLLLRGAWRLETTCRDNEVAVTMRLPAVSANIPYHCNGNFAIVTLITIACLAAAGG